MVMLKGNVNVESFAIVMQRIPLPAARGKQTGHNSFLIVCVVKMKGCPFGHPSFFKDRNKKLINIMLAPLLHYKMKMDLNG